jgi:hypothetical protein
MPVLSINGAMSARAYGIFGMLSGGVVIDGTLAIFALGYNGTAAVTTRNKYTYSGDVVSSATVATAASYAGSATGNSVEGIFALGYNALTTRDKYTYSGDVVSSATAASSASVIGSATGNSVEGIFALGYNGTVALTARDKYTYSGDVVSSATAASTASYYGSAASNGCVGVNM